MSWFSDIFSPVSDVLSPVLSFFGNESSNSANAEQAQNQMNFQERMSGTSYQRAVKDMSAAGLNPMLAYSAGGASTPSGSSASMTNSLGAGVSSAQAQSKLSADVDNIRADTAVKKADADLSRMKAFTEASTQDVNTQAVEQMHIANELAKGVNPSKISEARSNSAAAAARLPSAVNEGRAAGTWYGRNVMPFLPSMLQGAHSANAVSSMFK